MKTIQFITILFSAIVFMASCSNSQSSHEQHTHDANGETQEHSHDADQNKPAKNEEIVSTGMESQEAQEITTSYLALKTALVKGDQNEAQVQADNMIKAVDGSENALGKSIASIAKEISGTGDIAAQRKSFEELSENIYQLVAQVDMEKALYWQYCPMAFDGEGAHWISDSEEILNPYFGDRMLKCGKVQEKI